MKQLEYELADLNYCDCSKPRINASLPNQTIDVDRDILIFEELKADVSNSFYGFHVFYQPIFLVTKPCNVEASAIGALQKKVVAYEALCRWKNVPPSQFIPIAERSGLINPIGQWVISTVASHIHKVNHCDEFAAEEKRNEKKAKYFVNLSPVQLTDPKSFLIFLNNLSKNHSVLSNCLGFELTESIVNDGSDAIKDLIKKISDMGYEVALDDFGIGSSSLIRLRDFSVDKIKIDRSFSDVDHQNSNIILKHLLRMGFDMDLIVVVEGIETQAQLETLVDMGFKYFQGFHLGMPSSISVLR